MSELPEESLTKVVAKEGLRIPSFDCVGELHVLGVVGLHTRIVLVKLVDPGFELLVLQPFSVDLL